MQRPAQNLLGLFRIFTHTWIWEGSPHSYLKCSKQNKDASPCLKLDKLPPLHLREFEEQPGRTLLNERPLIWSWPVTCTAWDLSEPPFYQHHKNKAKLFAAFCERGMPLSKKWFCFIWEHIWDLWHRLLDAFQNPPPPLMQPSCWKVWKPLR